MKIEEENLPDGVFVIDRCIDSISARNADGYFKQQQTAIENILKILDKVKSVATQPA